MVTHSTQRAVPPFAEAARREQHYAEKRPLWRGLMPRMARIVLPALLLGSAALLVTGCLESKAPSADLQKRQQTLEQSDHLIVPGQRIGPVRLGMGMDELAATLGQPDSIQKRSGAWLYWSLDLVVAFDSSAAPAVAGVTNTTWTGDPPRALFKTAEGIGIGSSSFDVKRTYGSPDEDQGEEFVYRSRKLSFIFRNYAVTMISLW
jgi:hypothetical protein